MRIADLLGREPVISFEFFPPKSDEAAEQLVRTVDAMRALNPAFISITYGAGGSTRERSVGLAKRIKRELDVEVMAHVTCVGHSQIELRGIFDELAAARIENVLALRGDPPRDAPAFTPAAGGFSHACELTALLARDYAFCVGGACYPEKHTEALDLEDDLANLVTKVAAGAAFLITQLFFDNDAYFAFVERARSLGIAIPIVPGIMPITNDEQIKRFTTMCGATIPPRLRAELDARAGDPAAIADLGVAFSTLQCADLLARGAPGIHFYTLNKSPATRAIVAALRARELLGVRTLSATR